MFAAEITPQAGPTISVSITGFVQNPGVYQMLPVNRLSDLLMCCGGVPARSIEETKNDSIQESVPNQVVTPGPSLKEEKCPYDYPKTMALRTVQLSRGGKKLFYDVLKFYRMGDDSQNPFLKDGDVVLISAVMEYVSISGGVNYPCEIQYNAGDKLQDIIDYAKGTSYDADLSAVNIYRFAENKIDFKLISLDLLQNPAQYGFALQAGDVCVVPQISDVLHRQKVKISGQVKHPGEYIITSKTTLADLIQQAGGVNSRGDLASLVHYNSYLNERNNAYLNQLLQSNLGSMTPLEYTYLRTNLQQMKGKYSFDVKKFAETEGKEANPILRDGDRVFVPERMDMVIVSGQVRHPGLIQWVQGKDWNYYVEQAGGYTNYRKHAKGRLIRGDSGNWIKPGKRIQIMAGDTLFVPSQSDRALWTDIKEGITLLSSVITIIVGLRALSTN
jgi:protein involved in polysaccharide export with SLBB domain